jgi:hypothetical protein
VLSVLQIVFRQHIIARRLRIARQREVFFSDMSRRAAHFHIGPVALKRARQWVLVFAMLAALPTILTRHVGAISAAPMIVVLPHERESSQTTAVMPSWRRFLKVCATVPAAVALFRVAAVFGSAKDRCTVPFSVSIENSARCCTSAQRNAHLPSVPGIAKKRDQPHPRKRSA